VKTASVAPETVVPSHRVEPGLFARKSLREAIARALTYAVLLTGAFVVMVPLVWTVSTSLKPLQLVFAYPPQWVPVPPRWENYAEVFERVPYGRFFVNTTVITTATVLGSVVSSSLVAYGFARLRFPGRDVLFLLLLSTLMLPFTVYMIPKFVLFRQLGWLNTFLPLIVPPLFGGGAFYIFLLRQFFMRVPLEMDDAAKIDGCGYLGVYARMLVPLSLPAHGVVAIFSFLAAWNDFLAPLLYLNTVENYTLAIGLHFFKGLGAASAGHANVEWHLLMAASVMMMAPCILIFFLAQRYFVQGIVVSGLKE
jgi:ABC-type glycerol-3-phosphate transport system permease component